MSYLHTVDIAHYLRQLMDEGFTREEAIQIICAWLRGDKYQ